MTIMWIICPRAVLAIHSRSLHPSKIPPVAKMHCLPANTIYAAHVEKNKPPSPIIQ
ncbi:hypothetical protein P280DRAFT_171859 [Massarina eburnea CBS 473.64]|uniref:Uncharacterized protein n=1 Tax=Massarina eburnea CBS 473.64 TaxID=1395130 RepID=A0A6A6SCK7_9PLEO|nr:hypothetical protein P280DRAFT_171859 [Massarina eburnea CBS 473.64]